MVKTFADEIYKEMKRRGLFDLFSDDPVENWHTLDKIVQEMNITKSSMIQIEADNPGTSLYLRYTIQNDAGVDMGVCEMFKTWFNNQGWQYGCYFDKGAGKRIQVTCYANQKNCQRKEQLEEYLKK